LELARRAVTRVQVSWAPRVDYALTDLGRSLLVAIEGLVWWTRTHREEIATARSGYDARRESSA
jgi:DNA-binding HxlR family transcriptional regulator